MSRFAKKIVEEKKSTEGIGDTYVLGHNDKFEYAYKSAKGISEARVREISALKEEPEWMLEIRLKALKIFCLEDSMRVLVEVKRRRWKYCR